MGVDNCTLQGCLIGAHCDYCCRSLVLILFPVCFSYVGSEPRDAGTDQKSSGIIRLHTIKQIIDQVSAISDPHVRLRWHYYLPYLFW